MTPINILRTVLQQSAIAGIKFVRTIIDILTYVAPNDPFKKNIPFPSHLSAILNQN